MLAFCDKIIKKCTYLLPLNYFFLMVTSIVCAKNLRSGFDIHLVKWNWELEKILAFVIIMYIITYST